MWILLFFKFQVSGDICCNRGFDVFGKYLLSTLVDFVLVSDADPAYTPLSVHLPTSAVTDVSDVEQHPHDLKNVPDTEETNKKGVCNVL